MEKKNQVDEEKKNIIVGVCAMEKKAQSRQMKEMLSRLQEFPKLETIVIPQSTIFEVSVQKWPICDCLISFHSEGFPLEKVQAYCKIRQPLVLNDLETQGILKNRLKVYRILQNNGIAVPRYTFADSSSIEESEDCIIVNGMEFHKPFVEKPISAEDHNIYMYFPSAAGGGSQRLFRKVRDKSSVYSAESNIRRDGEYIYEEFLPTDGTDVKVYTVGPYYAHAEARKSPGLDGKVFRDADGKEQRYPVILTPAEKLIARKICLAFKQTVCGFDLLRANGKTYVCDVNGFSFVKTSEKYYHDASRILAQMIFRHFRKPIIFPRSKSINYPNALVVPSPAAQGLELRCVVAVIRHGDRTPKQKIKLQVYQPEFLNLFQKLGGSAKVEIKLKTPNELQEILDIVRGLLLKGEIGDCRDKFEQIRFVLEMKGRFSGINRKVELKANKNSEGSPFLDLVIKWGGELTGIGRRQAEGLGQSFRHLYPLGRNCVPESQGIGLLRLHSTFRHDLKIYASDEARVQMTAAAFAKGLLALEGELPPIIAQMVKSANTNGLLSHRWEAHEVQKKVKSRLFQILKVDRDFTEEDKKELNPCESVSVAKAIDNVKNPTAVCNEIAKYLKQLIDAIEVKRNSSLLKPLYHGETWDFMHRRWRKLARDFEIGPNVYDPAKVPDIYDAIKYDLLHNKDALGFKKAQKLFFKVRDLADIIIPQENGITKDEKIEIGLTICRPLLKKIQADLQSNLAEEAVYQLDPEYSLGVSSPERQVRTRLYFTSESHIHGLLLVLLHASPWATDKQWRQALKICSTTCELDFLSQIVILLYEDVSQEQGAEERFHVEIHFSPGVLRNSPEESGRSDSVCESAEDVTDEMEDELEDTNTLANISPTTENLKAMKGNEIEGSTIHPLHTLHSALSHNQMNSFLQSTIELNTQTN